ncbi:MULTISPECIES: hypothetical protein [unclassified Paenibacillus]|uniref:hypothetical protein n=1 Tax=unclassified Paenibacillus TaxID=185978 RepID=UPI0030F65262
MKIFNSRRKEASGDEEKKPGLSELEQIASEKRKVQFYLRLMLGLGSTCGVMIPIEPFFTTLNELSAQETALLQKAKDQLDQSE